METRYIIGYIDEDISQVKLYRRKLRDYGFDVISYDLHTGMGVDELMHQVYQSNIDLLLIDFRLNERNIIPFNGDEVEKHIYEHKPLFPHIIFTNKVEQAEPNVCDLKLIFDKEVVFPEDDLRKTEHFINMLKKSIEQYKTRIANKKGRISELLSKEEQEGLNSREKNEILSLQNELLCLDKNIVNEIPEILRTVETLEKVSRARKDAESYIQSLLKNSNDEGEN